MNVEQVEQIVQQLLPILGGQENIASAAHCATRLRLVLVDDSKVDTQAITKVEGVKGCFNNAGQLQVIFGTGLVNQVHEELTRVTGISEASKSEVTDLAAKKLNPIQRLARTLSNIFVPIIPAIVSAGLLMGVLGLMKTYNWVDATSSLYILFDMFSSAAFIILPVLIGFSAAREFGGNPFLGAVIGGIMTHPALTNAWGIASGYQHMDFLGLDIAMVGYQGTVFPVMMTVWFMSKLERSLRKVVPHSLDLIVVPFLTIIVTGFVAMLLIGPAGRILGDGISWALNALYNQAGWLAGLVFGGTYSMIVITGIHHSFHAIEAGLLTNAAIGVNFLLPIWAAANVAQGGACLAVAIRTKDAPIKSIATPAGLSCLLGITEAALFGINLRFGKPFVAALVGGALGGFYMAAVKVGMSAVGLTGLPGAAIVVPGDLSLYLIGMVIAFGVAFAISWVLMPESAIWGESGDEAVGDEQAARAEV